MLGASIELTPEERRDVDALSDQSGTVGRPLDYAFYDTGYTSGRWYVVARTWIDFEAERRGTVWTHSLLIPMRLIQHIPDLGALSVEFRRPCRPLNMTEWTGPLHITSESRSPDLPNDMLRSLLFSWFLRDARPVLWEDPRSASQAVESLWRRLPPSHRTRFSYCTYAIQPRVLRGEPLAWMVPAPEAEGAWFRVRSTTAGSSPGKGGQYKSPISDLLNSSASELASVWARWPEVVAAASAGQLRVVLRYATLEERNDYSGALARLDCVEGLEDAGRTLAASSVERAMEALEGLPSISWLDVRQFVARAPHRLEPMLEDQIRSRLFSVLSQRVDEQSIGFEELTEVADRVGFGMLVDDAVISRQRRRTPTELVQDLAVSEPLQRRLERILESHPDGAGVAATYLHTDAPQADVVLRWAIADLDRAEAVLIAAPADLRFLRTLLGVGTASGRFWERILVKFDPSIVAAAVREGVSDGDPNRTSAFASSLARLPLPMLSDLPTEWSERALAMIFEHEPKRLAEVPTVAARLLRASPNHPSARLLSASLTDECGPEVLLPLLRPRDTQGARWTEQWADTILAEVVKVWLTGADNEAPDWLSLASDDAVRNVVALLEESSNAVLGRSFELTFASDRLREASVLRELWTAWAARPTSDLVPVIGHWAGLLNSLSNRVIVHRDACSVAFARALVGKHADFGDLAVASFPTVHDALRQREVRSSFVQFIEALWGFDWDRAKHVRRKVAAEWVRQNWRPDVLVKLAQNDGDLFEKLWRAACDEGGHARRQELLALSLPFAWARVVS